MVDNIKLERRVKRFWLSIVAVVFLLDCAGQMKKPILTLEGVTLAGIRYRVEQNNLRYRSAKAEVEVSVESPRINFTAGSRLLIKQPDSLLLTIRGPMGIGYGLLFIDHQKFVIYNSFENQVYTGDPRRYNGSSLLPIDIPINQLILAVSGLQQLTDAPHDSLTMDRNKYLIISSQDQLTRKFWIDPTRFVVTEFQLLDDNDRVMLQIEYQQFEQLGRLFLPRLIRFFQPHQNTRITLLYKYREANCRLAEKDFSFKIPEQAHWIEL